MPACLSVAGEGGGGGEGGPMQEMSSLVQAQGSKAQGGTARRLVTA